MKVLLLVPDGVGVRNFLLEPCGSVLMRQAEARVMTGFDPGQLPSCWQSAASPMRMYREGALGMVLRYALAYAHLRRWDTRAMRFVREMPVRGRWQVRLMHAVARMAGRVAASDGGILGLERVLGELLRRRGEVDHYAAELEAWRPDVIFCTHQRPSTVLPV
ncbi:MAG: hypothetical protein ACPL7M_10050, partial [Bryobacteraceae bacterium]